MEAIKASLTDTQAVIDKTQQAMEDSKMMLQQTQDECRQLVAWAQVFHESAIDVKKMIASCMIGRVTVSRDYNINVELNVTKSQFFNGMEMAL